MHVYTHIHLHECIYTMCMYIRIFIYTIPILLDAGEFLPPLTHRSPPPYTTKTGYIERENLMFLSCKVYLKNHIFIFILLIFHSFFDLFLLQLNNFFSFIFFINSYNYNRIFNFDMYVCCNIYIGSP